MSIARRLRLLEGNNQLTHFGLPRDPKATDELLARVRAERFRRIQADPRVYGREVARILAKLAPAERELALAAINEGLAPPAGM